MATTVFSDVFIVKTVGKGHGSTIRPLFLIGYDISIKTEGLNEGEYIIYWGGLTDRIAYARVVILLRLCSLEQCPDPVFRSLIKTCNFVTFYEFLIHLGMHHTKGEGHCHLFWHAEDSSKCCPCLNRIDVFKGK